MHARESNTTAGRWRLALFLLATLTAACASNPPRVVTATTAPATTTSSIVTTTTIVPTTTATTTATTNTTKARSVTTRPSSEVITVAYRVERHTTDAATEGFEDIVRATLSDRRGWERARFEIVEQADAPYLVVLAEGDEVDRRCLPYDTYGKYSCQNGPVVALNADRWRSADPKWTGDLATYRQMLVNHEFGHLLGQTHPRPQCPRRGEPAPVMNQQSTELNGCLPNPWPLGWEIALAARHDRPLAPGPPENRR